MTESVKDMVERWTRASGKTQHFSTIFDLLRLLASELYSEYQPFPESAPFMDRLRLWLDQVPDEDDRKCLFEFVPWLLFIGRREMESMYRAAFSGPISRWIIDDANLDICDISFPFRFQQAVEQTFFGSIAGMDIGSFIRVNELRGQSIRPDFRVLEKLGDVGRTDSYLKSEKKTRIVAVEDYVGTGSQMREAAGFLSQLADFKTLLNPLVVSPIGVIEGERLSKHSPQLSFVPLFVVPSCATLPGSPPVGVNEPIDFPAMRSLVKRLWSQVQGTIPDPQLYTPFGFGSTGSLVMTYFNCPDNMPPLVHHLSDTWKPLFRRLYREA